MKAYKNKLSVYLIKYALNWLFLKTSESTNDDTMNVFLLH